MMTDIEKLRDAVIDAARAWGRIQRGCRGERSALDRLEDSIKTLDEAEKPDPWEILKQLVGNDMICEARIGYDKAIGDVKAALAWKEQNDE